MRAGFCDSRSQVYRHAHFRARWKLVFTYLKDVVGSPQYLCSAKHDRPPS